MAKKIKAVVKMLIKAGNANPAPPVGSILGPYGLNLAAFCKEFNDKTTGQQGMVPALITIYEDRSYEMEIKTAPVAELIKQALNIKSGSGKPNKESVGSLSREQALEIAKKKMPDLNAFDEEAALKQVEGTCKSMGVKIKLSA